MWRWVALVVKNPPVSAGDIREHRFYPWVRKIPRRRAWQPTPIFLPGESHGKMSMVDYGPWGHKESDTTEAIKHAHTLYRELSSPCILTYERQTDKELSWSLLISALTYS